MPDFPSIPAFNGHLDKFLDHLNTDVLTAIGKQIGKQAQQIAASEAATDLGGNASFSGWRRGKPIQLATVADQFRPGLVSFHPTKVSAGPWTVAERGRNQGSASGFSGPGVNRKTGVTGRTKSGAVRKVRAFKAKRWNGTTDGKGTASRAVARIERVPEGIGLREVGKAVKKFFD